MCLYSVVNHGTKMDKLLVVALIIFSTEIHFGQGRVNSHSIYEGFSPQQIAQFHNDFKHDYNNWAVGGDFTRYVLLNMSKYWPHEIIYSKGPVRQLNYTPNEQIDKFIVRAGKTELTEVERFDQDNLTFLEYVHNGLVDGLIVLHHGDIVFEHYPRMYPTELHNWMSVTKTLVATVISILEERKQLDIALSVEHYIPELKKTTWEGLKIIDILNMSSGVNCAESESAHVDPNSCFNNFFTEVFHAKDLDNQIDLLKKMNKKEEPGQTFEYTSINTAVLTMVIEKVTSKPFNQVLQHEIWNYAGSESNALMLTTKYSGAQTFLGMNSTLRDLARYGLLYTPSGRSSKFKVITDKYLRRIQSDHNQKLYNKSWFFEEEKYNSYHWDDVFDDGDFVKYGLGGQGLYISPSRDLVIAYFGTHNLKKEWGRQMEFTRQLAVSGLFDQ